MKINSLNSKLQNLIKGFVSNSTDESKMQLYLDVAVEYDKLGQHASAFNSYLKFLELSTYNNFAPSLDYTIYLVYIRLGEIFEEMGNRTMSAKVFYHKAVSYMPYRPEAYYYLSRLCERNKYAGNWDESLAYANIGIDLQVDKEMKSVSSTKIPLNYPKEYGLYFQRSVAASWLNQKDNSLRDLQHIKNNISKYIKIDEVHTNAIDRNIRFLVNSDENLLKNDDFNDKFPKLEENNNNSDSKNTQKMAKITEKSPKIVDFFPYFQLNGENLLELRINMLKDYVDEFIICESNKTQMGHPIERNLSEKIKELGLPEDKIRIIELDIPDSDELVVEEIDRLNTLIDYDHNKDQNLKNIHSIHGRVRERLQKDSLLSVIHEYADDTIFIHSDSDEIINPTHLKWIIPHVIDNQHSIIKIPLVQLEGRGDLRVHYTNGNTVDWSGGMFLATARQLKEVSPIRIRSNNHNKFPIAYLKQDGKRIEDLGWHFSWQGSVDDRVKKVESFMHSQDSFDHVIDKKYNVDDQKKSTSFSEGDIPPSRIKNTVLKEYDHQLLPETLINSEKLRTYFNITDNSNCRYNGTCKYEHEIYLSCINEKSDINEHLPLLRDLANDVNHITEFGVAHGNSTCAFLSTGRTLRSYDIEYNPDIEQLFTDVELSNNADIKYIVSDILDIEIEPTDFLFIDTLHTYKQVSSELKLHANKVSKYIAFHDTHTYGLTDQINQNSEITGILPAILNFMVDNPEWKLKYYFTNNNGLIVIEKPT